MLLFDTDVIIDFLRGYEPSRRWFLNQSPVEVAIPGLVLMELIDGCRNQREQRSVLRELSEYTILWPSEHTCAKAFAVFASLHLSHSIGILDAIIGQIAIDHHVPLYTFNTKHYGAIPELKLKEPYERT